MRFIMWQSSLKKRVGTPQMNKYHSRLGLTISIGLHAMLLAGLAWTVSLPSTPKQKEQMTSISIEMFTAMLEPVQTEPPPEAIEPPNEPEQQPVTEPPEQVVDSIPEPEPVIEPIAKPKPKTTPVVEKQLKPKPIQKPKQERDKSKKETVKKPNTVKVEKTASKTITGKVQAQSKVTANKVPQTPTVETPKAEVVPSASADELQAYKAKLQKALQQNANKRYPRREQMMQKTGIVTLSFSLSANGQVINVKLLKSSGNENLDNAAVQAAQSTSLNLAPPAGFAKNLTVPIRFSLE